MTRREFLCLVDRCKLKEWERKQQSLPTAEEDIRYVLDEAYPFLTQSKEWIDGKKHKK